MINLFCALWTCRKDILLHSRLIINTDYQLIRMRRSRDAGEP